MRGLRLYVGAVCALAAGAAVAVWAAGGTDGPERPWLAAGVAALIALEHLFAIGRLAVGRREGESHTHEESFFVAMALLASPVMVLAAFAAGFLAGNLLTRRSALKTLFNVAVMVGAPSVGLLVLEALGGAATASARSGAAVIAAAVVTAMLNRAAVAGVLALTGSADFRRNVLDDLPGRALVVSGDISLGLLVGFAAADQMWTLPFGLVALAALHFTLTGHVRARAEQQKLGDLVASSSDGILAVGPDGRVTSWNPACERITGYPGSRVMGMRLDDVSELLEARRQPHPPFVEQLFEDDGEPSVVRIRAADGSDRWIAVTRAPLPEGGSVIVFRDETTRRQVDELLAQQETERLRADFVATVSHELRTPLTSVLGFTKTLLARDRGDPVRTRYLEIMNEQGERLSALIDDLLDLRQIGEGRFTVGSDPVDLAGLLAEQVAVFREHSEAHTIALDLPNGPIPVRGDAQRLKQVVANLISNAIKYSPAGGEVSVAAAVANGHVRVSVSDQGLGIPAEQQPNVFNRFFRVQSQRHREVGGTGLGLALAREIVEAHGGEIGFDSRENEGSTFYFELPTAA